MANNTNGECASPKRLTRKQRKALGRQISSANPGLEVIHEDAAGIDIGSREHYVAVGPDRDCQPVRTFAASRWTCAEWRSGSGHAESRRW